MAENKETIYVDIDDEITTIIDKLKAVNGRLVALVLPKRASVLQSAVNMKLLKRAADQESKQLVLITNETGILHLAGAAGLYVAKTLTSKPEIPSETLASSPANDLDISLDDEKPMPNLASKAAAGATVGSLADAAAGKPATNGDMETVELDNGTEDKKAALPAAGAATATAAAATATKAKKNKGLKVPNFNRFRTGIILAVLALIALIVLGIFAFDVWPHATVDVKTDASNVNTNLNLTLDPSTQSADLSSGDLPAKVATDQKTFSASVPATGQKNEGTPASGNVSMTANDCSGNYLGNPSFTIPSGTGISYNNQTYITQSDTTMNANKYDFKNNCVSYASQSSTPIAAQTAGTQGNAQISGATVSGYPGVTANGSASGGTDNIVQIVSQADITSATSKISSSDGSTVEQSLEDQLKGEGLYPVAVTFAKGSPSISSSPNVGDQASSVTVTETLTYSMFGAYQNDLNQALIQNIRSQTSKNQNIITTGLNQQDFKQDGMSGSADQVSLATTAEVGPNISAAAIKKMVEGKAPAQIISSVKQNPDVTSVTVRLSPFWVTSAPSSAAKITVHIAKPTRSV